jgi:hypothetical protein
MDNVTLALRKEFPGDWFDDLTPLAEQLLREAEEFYSERDRTWTFLGGQVGEFKENLTWSIDKTRKLACIYLQKLLPDHWPFSPLTSRMRPFTCFHHRMMRTR